MDKGLISDLPVTDGETKGHPPDGQSTLRQIRSDDLFGDSSEIEIMHNGAHYRLRKTSLGKLILTK